MKSKTKLHFIKSIERRYSMGDITAYLLGKKIKCSGNVLMNRKASQLRDFIRLRRRQVKAMIMLEFWGLKKTNPM